MKAKLMRETLPDRRRSWTKEVRIEGQVVFLGVGEYDDGRPGEIFVDVAKAGTFIRGVMGTLARTASIALQHGAGVEVVIASLIGGNYPPNGMVIGSDVCTECKSVTDWIAKELAHYYNVPLPQDQDIVGSEEDMELEDEQVYAA